MSEHILVDVKDKVMTITFNRPDKKNALTHAMYQAINSAIERANTDKTVRAVLFLGAGGVFTAGNDLMDFRDKPPLGPDAPVSRFLQNMLKAEKPIVAAVGGVAVGVGLTMLLHCDLVIGSKSARLSAPFVDLALVPEAGSSLLLPRTIGHALASDMFFTGRVLSAEEALAVGILSRLYEDADLEGEARKLALSLARKAPDAIRLTRRLMRGDRADVAKRMAEEGELFARQLVSKEMKEAIQAFLEKRAPDFG
ncbi:enoyl-CoA hydratase [Pseudokordiimonas caeni]|uniref:enoyl-CoA hydratase n=1 Tax=Pseudokordiimonas caeni TaxID=2997908 RepID=UPI0028124616|nr:enoyl-CoA hydratase [Pseudokordiimonas caeni]